ncbi:hypothetical protein [Anabaena azotica]|uniref:Uncharacterized protein n=1 Tax=Anabaena azotica FACHB-119 TaxID=947527 RepID=A0ABR8DBM1_9NOST|nr:hypothetical protein [Anabaena azotica]MBD2503966.1 hypothetical protein [Anabaena azotica FACHB-119]
MSATAKVEITLDTETYEKLTEKQLESLAIAKLKTMEVEWVSEEIKDKEIDISKLSEEAVN